MSEQAGFTPGPWRAMDRGAYTDFKGKSQVVIGDDMRIAVVHSHNERDEANYKRICKGAIVLTAQTPFDKVLGASNLQMLRYEWIWEKTNATGHLNARRAPMKAHENVLVFYKNIPTYNPIKTTGHVRKVANADRSRLQSSNYGTQAGVTVYDSTERYPRSVITFASDKQRVKLHPTQKPLALMDYFIRTYTNPGDVVLDNCMGSGTTGVACRLSGRRFIGIENKPEFFAVAERRIMSELEVAA